MKIFIPPQIKYGNSLRESILKNLVALLSFGLLFIFPSCSEQNAEPQKTSWERAFSYYSTIDFVGQMPDGTSLVYGDGRLFAVDNYGKSQWVTKPFQNMSVTWIKQTDQNNLLVGGTDWVDDPPSAIIGLYSSEGIKIWKTKVIQMEDNVWPISIAKVSNDNYAIATIKFDGSKPWAFTIHVLDESGNLNETYDIVSAENGSTVRDVWLTSDRKIFVQQMNSKVTARTPC